MRANRCLLSLAMVTLSALAAPAPARADELRCEIVRLADVGWTDVTVTTAIAGELLRSLGYAVRVDLLAVPVTFMSLNNGDVDVFLGNWMPGQTGDVKPYLDKGSIVDVHVNLQGALYTFAVPTYVHEAGVRSALDLARFKDRFGGRIYGIEAGNEGNRRVLDMIAKNDYGLSGWSLVESSEQGMLAEVGQAFRRRDWIVFFGWRPHPMNATFNMTYLEDPRELWGPGGGASEVHTVANRQFLASCPNVAHLLRNLTFDQAAENVLMKDVLEGMRPADAVLRWMNAHPQAVAAWRDGVLRADEVIAKGGHGVVQAISADPPPRHRVGELVGRGVALTTRHFAASFRGFAEKGGSSIDGVTNCLLRIPAPAFIAAFALLVLAIHRRWRLAAGVALGLTSIWSLGYWQATVETLVLVVTATLVSVAAGVPIGILAARRPRLRAPLMVLLDLMQTVPTFVYLIPTLMLFGLGTIPGLLSTIVFAIPAPVRLTWMGISRVPPELLEAGDALGAGPFQRLWKIELPHARPAIVEGVTQALMLSLSMVVIAALVGARGLGTPVVRALNSVDMAQGFEAGLAIVIVAVVLDRTFRRKHAHG